jgi:hypothetical protein
MDKYSVSELARGKDRGHPMETVCILADIRNNSRPASLQIWSYGLEKVVSLPRKLIRNHTHEAQRWAAISAPRWLVNKERLWGGPATPHVPRSDYCTDMKTPQMSREDGERDVAEYVINRENRHIKRPGEHWEHGRSDRRNGAIMA